MKILAAEEVEAGTSTADGGAVEEAVDFWEVHNVAKKMRRVRSHYGESSNQDAFECNSGETKKKELKAQTHTDSLAAVIAQAVLELAKVSDSAVARKKIAEGKACTRPQPILKSITLITNTKFNSPNSQSSSQNLIEEPNADKAEKN